MEKQTFQERYAAQYARAKEAIKNRERQNALSQEIKSCLEEFARNVKGTLDIAIRDILAAETIEEKASAKIRMGKYEFIVGICGPNNNGFGNEYMLFMRDDDICFMCSKEVNEFGDTIHGEDIRKAISAELADEGVDISEIAFFTKGMKVGAINWGYTEFVTCTVDFEK